MSTTSLAIRQRMRADLPAMYDVMDSVLALARSGPWQSAHIRADVHGRHASRHLLTSSRSSGHLLLRLAIPGRAYLSEQHVNAAGAKASTGGSSLNNSNSACTNRWAQPAVILVYRLALDGHWVRSRRLGRAMPPFQSLNQADGPGGLRAGRAYDGCQNSWEGFEASVIPRNHLVRSLGIRLVADSEEIEFRPHVCTEALDNCPHLPYITPVVFRIWVIACFAR